MTVYYQRPVRILENIHAWEAGGFAWKTCQNCCWLLFCWLTNWLFVAALMKVTVVSPLVLRPLQYEVLCFTSLHFVAWRPLLVQSPNFHLLYRQHFMYAGLKGKLVLVPGAGGIYLAGGNTGNPHFPPVTDRANVWLMHDLGASVLNINQRRVHECCGYSA